jgi:transcriptional regulator with XRE-family HTH domain
MTDEAVTEVFKTRLRTAREQRGLSQTQLAERARIPASSVSHFESGARKPSFDNLKRIATALDVTTDYLLGRVDQMNSVGAAETIHRHLANLTAGDLKLADELLAVLARKGNDKDADR